MSVVKDPSELSDFEFYKLFDAFIEDDKRRRHLLYKQNEEYRADIKLFNKIKEITNGNKQNN